MLKVFELPQTWYATTLCCCGWGGLTYSGMVGYQVGVLPSVLHFFAFLPQHEPIPGTVSDPAISLP